jgi:hypothetical protein
MGTLLIQHKGLDLEFELPEILQGSLEVYEKELSKYVTDIENIQVAVWQGGVVRAATKAGWLEGLKEKEIDSMKPNAIAWLSARIVEHVSAAREIPPN